MNSIHANNDEKAPDPTLEQLSANVYAYVQLDGSWGLNNSCLLYTSDAAD